MLDSTIHGKWITDPKLLRQWNYDEPVLELYNDFMSTVIPLSELSPSRLHYEIGSIMNYTAKYITRMVMDMLIMARRGTVAGDKKIEKVMSEIMRR